MRPCPGLPFAVLVGCLAFACGAVDPPGTSRHLSPVAAWQTGTTVGFGVSRWDTGNPLGANVFIGYGGYGISLAQTQAWVAELYATRLRTLGVSTVFAVQGPADVGYAALEIGNSKIGAFLQQSVSADTGFILVAAHSSGAFVADEFLQQLGNGSDPTGALAGRVVYVNLEGGQKYVTTADLQRLRRIFHVSAWDPATGQVAWNHDTMASLGNTWANKGGFLRYDAGSSGCTNGGCLHITLINTRPHSASAGSGTDYADFTNRPVHNWYVDALRASAGLGQCTTAFLTQGAIESRYVLLGGCHSPLGAPRTDTTPTVDGVGRFNLFEQGAIYSTPDGGTYALLDPAFTAWGATGHETGPLGYPVADSTQSGGQFEHGSLTVLPDGGVQLHLDGEDAGAPEAPDAGASTTDAGEPTPDAGTLVPAPTPAQGCSTDGGAPVLSVVLALLLARGRRRHHF